MLALISPIFLNGAVTCAPGPLGAPPPVLLIFAYAECRLTEFIWLLAAHFAISPDAGRMPSQAIRLCPVILRRTLIF